MKKTGVLLIAHTILLFACRKEEVKIPDFDVKVESQSYKVGEEVTFKFTGEANQLSFYSGEQLRSYAYSKESRVSTTQSVRASFRTNVTNFTAETGQNNQLAVFVSSDYNGGGTYADITNATWKGTDDYNPFFAIAPDTNPWGSANNFPSGVVDLIEGFEEGKPLYIGFRYKNTPPVATTGWPRAWYIYNMDVNASTLLGSSNLFNTVGVFSLVYSDHFNTQELKNSAEITTYIRLSLPVALRPDPAEIWAISPPIYLEEIDHGPDRSIPIKGYRDPMPVEFKHIYTEPGTYTVTFVGSNTNVYGEIENVKQVELIINE